MLELLKACVKARLNILISGGTGAGKTTLLNALSGYIPEDERIVTIEDAAELQLQQTHVARMETRPPNVEGQGAIHIRQLVINALRMRPDRIIVGEVRGEEALDMLQAMNTGHDGSLTTIHANTPRDAVGRLEVMVGMANANMGVRSIRQQIASAVDLFVQVARFSDGTRRVTHITEVVGMEGDMVTLQDIFLFEKTGLTESGKVTGRFRATGIRPKFYDRLRVLRHPVARRAVPDRGGDRLICSVLHPARFRRDFRARAGRGQRGDEVLRDPPQEAGHRHAADGGGARRGHHHQAAQGPRAGRAHRSSSGCSTPGTSPTAARTCCSAPAWTGRRPSCSAPCGLASGVGLFAGTLLTPFRLNRSMTAPGWPRWAPPLPYLFVRRKARKRMAEMEEQLPEALDFLARSMRAGHAFTISLEMLGEELPDPLGQEFRTLFNEQNLGAPIDIALHNFALRVPLLDARFFCSAVLLQRQTGGNLSEILARLSYLIRERFRLRGQVKAASSHGRMTAAVLSALPIVTVLGLMLVAPGYLHGMAADPDGRMMIGGAVVGQLLGHYCIKPDREYQGMTGPILIPVGLFALLMAGISYFGWRRYAKPGKIYEQLGQPVITSGRGLLRRCR